MVKRHRRSDASVVSVPVEAPPATLGPAPGTYLMELPTELLADVARWALQLGAGGALSLTCRALANTNLSHAPSLHIQLHSQGCDQFLSGRSQFQLLTPVDAVLRARTCKLALTLEQQQDQHTKLYIKLLTDVLKKLGSCAAVEACKLGTIQSPSFRQLGQSHCAKLAQRLLDSFPTLTSLSLHGYETPCSGIASLLRHPRLSLQLQQLDLSSTTILKPKRPEPGAATLDNLFHASRLKQLRLSIQWVAGEDGPRMPNLQPLSQHLTQLCLKQNAGLPENVIAALQPLAQLQVLTISCVTRLGDLPRLLQALPQLHTLQLPYASVFGQVELDALLAATQLTSIQFKSVQQLTSSRADAPCNWQRLDLRDPVHCATAAYLPLHSLTQPLVLEQLVITGYDNRTLVAAAVHNLTQACKVPVRINDLMLDMAALQQVDSQQLVAELQPLSRCSRGRVYLRNMDVGAADVLTLAPLYQGCTQLHLAGGSLTPSLEFWRHLMQLMPTVTDVVFEHVEGSTSSAMHQSLQLMADQPWARWLDICIIRHQGSPELPACWLADNPSKPGKLRVWFKA